jgi:phage baseplate assembly protein W
MATDYLTDLNTYYGTVFKANQILLTSTDALNQQILNLLNTSPADVLFEPEFGSLVQHYLFEPIDSNTAYNIKIWVLEAIERWLPFIEMVPEKSSVLPNLATQSYNITITYSIKNTDQIGSVKAQLARAA